MKDSRVVRAGIVGAVFTAIYCFTPILLVGLGVVGRSAWLGWLDYVLLPALAASLGMVAWGLWRQRRAAECCAPASHSKSEGR